MTKEVEVLTINNKQYVIVNEISYKNTVYLFLSNLNNVQDTIIQKLAEDNDTVIPLDNENEYNLACNIFFKSIA